MSFQLSSPSGVVQMPISPSSNAWLYPQSVADQGRSREPQCRVVLLECSYIDRVVTCMASFNLQLLQRSWHLSLQVNKNSYHQTGHPKELEVTSQYPNAKTKTLWARLVFYRTGILFWLKILQKYSMVIIQGLAGEGSIFKRKCVLHFNDPHLNFPCLVLSPL